MTLLHRLLTCLILASLVGCGGRIHPVNGIVVWQDGKPATELAGYTVTLESTEHPTGAEGVVREDGTFTVGTEKPGDGALLGKHRAALTPPDPLGDVDRPRPKSRIPARYHDLKTSGLEVLIEAKTNRVELKVSKQ